MPVTGVYLIVDTPQHTRVVQEGQPPTTMAAWYHPAQAGEELADVVMRVGAAYPIGSTIVAFDEAARQELRIAPSVELWPVNA